jgi:REP element-mobilizing transposase RayT
MKQINGFAKQDNQTDMRGVRFGDTMKVGLSNNRSEKGSHEYLDAQPDIESSDYAPYVTSYVCLLAPRFEEHLIIGDLSEWLHVWMQDVCISFGWRLRFIDIKPEYIHWVISVGINTSPTQFMRTIRRETSSKILEEFPRIRIKNMSKDFWAPWHFLRVGQTPYHANALQEILEEIRSHQGLR